VPPPPKPNAVDPALAPVLESLKQTLLSSGRVEYTYVRGDRTNRVWDRITSAVVDARGCQARVHYDSADSSRSRGEPRDRTVSLFFESIDTVEAQTLQEQYDRAVARVGGSGVLTFSGAVYAVTVNGERGGLVFGSLAGASKTAEAVRRAAQICRAAPVTLSTVAGAPSLADTLRFIEEKLNDAGAVDFRDNTDGSDDLKMSWSHRLTQAAADPSSCLVRVNSRYTANGKAIQNEKEVVSFRRVEKLEVASRQDVLNRYNQARGEPSSFRTEPVVYQVTVTYLGGGILELYFRDEEMANRIAKAMNHAVELCGGGSKDPF
jgi:hypothetical protein